MTSEVQRSTRHVFVGWTKDEAGAEFADVRLGVDGLAATGVALAGVATPYRVRYELLTDADLVTTRLTVACTGVGWQRVRTLAREPGAGWKDDVADTGDVPYPSPGPLPDQGDALDVDLQLSPLFNTMPVLRHALHDDGGEAVELVALWVALPDLSVRASRQRYSHLGTAPEGTVVRFDDLDDGFTAELVYDADGLVLDYQGIGRRIQTDAHRNTADG